MVSEAAMGGAGLRARLVAGKKFNPVNDLGAAPGYAGQGSRGLRSGFILAEDNGRVSGVAERYANALFELALESDAVDEVGADLGRFSRLVDDSADLRRLVASPVFSAADQLRAVAAVLDRAEIGGLVGNLIKVAAMNRRLFTFPGIARVYARLVAVHRDEIAAEVVSAEPLSDRQTDDLKAALKARLGKDVALDASVDPALIGGLTVKVGSRMVDGSLRTKLNSLKLAMKEVG